MGNSGGGGGMQNTSFSRFADERAAKKASKTNQNDVNQHKKQTSSRKIMQSIYSDENIREAIRKGDFDKEHREARDGLKNKLAPLLEEHWKPEGSRTKPQKLNDDPIKVLIQGLRENQKVELWKHYCSYDRIKREIKREYLRKLMMRAYLSKSNTSKYEVEREILRSKFANKFDELQQQEETDRKYFSFESVDDDMCKDIQKRNDYVLEAIDALRVNKKQMEDFGYYIQKMSNTKYGPDSEDADYDESAIIDKKIQANLQELVKRYKIEGLAIETKQNFFHPDAILELLRVRQCCIKWLSIRENTSRRLRLMQSELGKGNVGEDEQLDVKVRKDLKRNNLEDCPLTGTDYKERYKMSEAMFFKKDDLINEAMIMAKETRRERAAHEAKEKHPRGASRRRLTTESPSSLDSLPSRTTESTAVSALLLTISVPVAILGYIFCVRRRKPDAPD